MLLPSEITRLRYELGYNVLAAGAAPYIGVTEVFNQVIALYTTAGATTTSATPVAAATAPTPVALTLASATGFSAGDRIVVDVDDRQEVATTQSLTGATVTALLSKVHSGTYPVCVEGGESVIRDILGKIRLVDQAQLDVGLASGGIKKADEVEFFGSRADGGGPAAALSAQREYWRQELADSLGVVYLRKLRRGSASSGVELY